MHLKNMIGCLILIIAPLAGHSQMFDTGNKVGIGTSAPQSKLHVRQSGTIGSKWNPSAAYLQLSDGTVTMIADGNELYTSDALYLGFGVGKNIIFREVGPTSARNLMRINANGQVGIGIDNPRGKLDVNGTVRSKEVLIETTNWPDYVFEKDYALMSLPETEAFINTHGHLPEVPSADEVVTNGIPVGEMNVKLLQKIEELTLHVIQLRKELNALQSVHEKE